MQTKKNQLWKVAIILAIAFLSLPLKAQVTIGSQTAPNPDAVLELYANTKLGLLLPRLNLSATNSASPMSAHVQGMLVYNLASAGTAPNNVVPGIYYNDGTRWIPVRSADYATFTGKVYTTTQTTYTVPDDAYLVITNASTFVTVTMPTLTAADAGRTIYIMNNNTGGASNQFDPSILGTGVNQAMGRGSVFIWSGTVWVSVSK